LTNRALVLAHYHSRGALRSDTLELLAAAGEFFPKILLISTALERAEVSKVPREVEVQVRPNIGYDFYSYRQGLLQLLNQPDAGARLDEICLMNSSFVCLDGRRFLQRLLRDEQQLSECFGLVKSWQFAEHVQSYVLILKRPVFSDARVVRWWTNMVPLSQRDLVIVNYEIGFSRLLVQLGYRLSAAYDHRTALSEAVKRLGSESAQEAELNAMLNAMLNPSHFHWLELLREFATLKIEVFRRNPCALDLRHLTLLAQADARVREVLAEGMQN
jgi:lipopolysaccharide biosynthesis protein